MTDVYWSDPLPCVPSTSPLTSIADTSALPAAIRPYACALSPGIELAELPGGDLADKVQHALARIVSELHLIGGWTSDCARQLNMSTPQGQHSTREDQSTTATSTSFVTPSELERLRREVTRELRSEIAKSTATAFASVTASKDAESASIGAQITALERSVAQLHATHQSELAALSRRVEAGDSTLTLQVADARRDAHDARLEARKAHDQVAAALRVLRFEAREQHEQTQRRLQQLACKVGSLYPPGKSPACSPRSAPNATGNHAAASSALTTPSSILPVGAGVMLQTGASAIATSDCFVYAKASLPPHRLDTAPHGNPKTGSVSSLVAKRVLAPSKNRANAADIDTGDALQVKSAVLQVPLGYDEDEEEEDEVGKDVMLDDVDGPMEDHSHQLEWSHGEPETLHQVQTTVPARGNGYLGVRANSVSAASIPSPVPRFYSSRLHSLPIVTASSATSSLRKPSSSMNGTTHTATQSKSNAHINVTPKPPAPR